MQSCSTLLDIITIILKKESLQMSMLGVSEVYATVLEKKIIGPWPQLNFL